MILTDAVAIKQLSPFFILFLASIFLKENKYCENYCFCLAFIGAILIIKPGFNLDIYPAIVGIFGAIVTAVTHIALRSLRLTDHPLVIVNYFGYVIGLLSLGLLLWQGNFVIPDSLSILILLLLGLVGLAAQIALTKAYRLAPIKLVSFYYYLQIVFSAVIGVLFF